MNRTGVKPLSCTGRKKTHCGSGFYWISVDGFSSPGEDDVIMNLKCVCVHACVYVSERPELRGINLS